MIIRHVETYYKILCDEEECQQYMDGYPSEDDAINDAKQMGWIINSEGRNTCPFCHNLK